MCPYIMNPDEPTAFGRHMLRRHFLIDSKYRPLNHGSFGTFPAAVQIPQRKFQDEQELRPDYFFQRSHGKYIHESRIAIAELVHAPVNECVFVTNVSTGINTVLRNLEFKSGDVIIFSTMVYPSVESCSKKYI